MALPLRRRIGDHTHLAVTVDGHGRGADRAVLGACLAPHIDRQQHRQIAHVRDARLGRARQADAVELALLARRFAPGDQLVQTALANCGVERLLIVPRIEQRTGGSAIRERIGRDEIAADHVERIELQLDRDALHQSLEREIDLRSAEAAHQTHRDLVGEHDAVADRQVADLVRAGSHAVHAIERPGHRCAQQGAVLLEVIAREREDLAFVRHRGFDRGDAMRPRARREQMLVAVFHPFHRSPGLLRGQADQHDVRKDRQLRAEAAAGVGRRAQPEFVARHPQCARHHSEYRERTLEVGGDVVAVFGGIVIGDDHIAFHRRTQHARVLDLELHAMRRARERRVGIAIAKASFMHDVGLARRMQQRRVGAGGGARVGLDRQRFVLDVDVLERVFGFVSIARHDDGNRLADVAHPIDRERPIVDRGLHPDDEGLGVCLDLRADQHRGDTGSRQRLARIHALDQRVCMGRTQDCRVERAAAHRDVVTEQRGAGEER